MRHTVTRDRHSVGRVSRRVQTQDNLDRHVRGGHVERREHGLRHALSVRLGFQKSVRERSRMFLRRDVLHVGPIRDDTVLYGILQLAAGRSGRGAAPVAIAAGEFSHGGPTSL